MSPYAKLKCITMLTLRWLGESALRLPPSAKVFCPLLKIYIGNPYLKILGLSKLFVADAPMILPLRALRNTGLKIALA